MTAIVNETVIADEEQADVAAGPDRDAWRELVGRLNRQSTDKHFDAYADVAWDSPEMRIELDDPRWELTADDPLGATEWYRSQPQAVRAEIGLMRIASNMKVGLQFESILQRGLLEYAAKLPDGSPEFRYAYHEVIEEAQHSLMFQEFVNRSGLPVRGMPWFLRRLAEWFVVPLARVFPTLFFLFVLGGEDPVDHLQRRVLSDGGTTLHPLVERIMRIHTTEEARHLSFARKYLQRTVPGLGRLRRLQLALLAPVVLGVMARLMLQPPRDLVRRFGIPGDVVRAANRSPAGRQLLKDSVGKTRRLFRELGLITPASKALWKAAGLWDTP